MDRLSARQRDAWAVFWIALALRAAVVAWARGRFPPAGDGYYYDVLAHRIASGAGYTWLWSDGAVTYAAHYPVGFPALLAAAYWLFGPSDTAAMGLTALLGALGAYATHRLVDDAGPRWRPLGAGLAVALHPALVPYTAARMTEGVTASLLLGASALTKRARATEGWVPLCLAGVAMAAATLTRPQSLVLAPILGWLAPRAGAGLRARFLRLLAITGVVLACASPWTLRNCLRMGRCAVVSVNGGWNLLIGTATTTGGWQPIDVPSACATVWDEASKDACFGQAAIESIKKDPLGWLGRMPSKVAMTLDYLGGAPWYLSTSNEAAFGMRAKTIAETVETVVSRLLELGALFVCSKLEGPRKSARRVVALLGSIATLTPHGWIGYFAIAVCVGFLGRAMLRAPMVVPISASVILATIGVHAVFFGSGRYGLIVAPFVAALAFVQGRRGRDLASGGPRDLRIPPGGCIFARSAPLGRSSGE